MAALGWLMNLSFSGGDLDVAAAVALGINPRVSYSHRRKRPYGEWISMFRRLRWASSNWPY
ncbi:hypothetical protein LCGC14_1715860 [marine sediment metagenome]|uniref:Uncharacterized protein n=1 Tax=marine sediment metagenome TaxID=412755 RepID=A0A0F9JUA8_9ZZZZ